MNYAYSLYHESYAMSCHIIRSYLPTVNVYCLHSEVETHFGCVHLIQMLKLLLSTAIFYHENTAAAEIAHVLDVKWYTVIHCNNPRSSVSRTLLEEVFRH